MNDMQRDRANGARLRLLRGDKTQQQVADELGLTKMMVSSFEMNSF